MIQDFVAAFSERAHRTGLGRLEFYIKENSGQAVQVYEGEVERLELASETLIYVEGEYQGYRGSTLLFIAILGFLAYFRRKITK